MKRFIENSVLKKARFRFEFTAMNIVRFLFLVHPFAPGISVSAITPFRAHIQKDARQTIKVDIMHGLNFKALAIAAIVSLVAISAGATSASAQDSDVFNAAERDRIEELIQDYIRENPDVLKDTLARSKSTGSVSEKSGRSGDRGAQEPLERSQQAVDNTTVNEVPVRDAKPGTLLPADGPEDASVTIVEFFDYNCPYCRKATPELRKLKQNADVRVLYRGLPVMSRSSALASAAALTVYQRKGMEAYMSVHNTFMDADQNLDREDILSVVEQAGVPRSTVAKSLKSGIARKTLKHNDQLLEDLLGRKAGTPTFVIGDKVITGYRSYADLQTLVESAGSSGSGS